MNEVQHGHSLDSEPDLPSNDDADEQPPAAAQEETCDWESPKLSAPADIPDGQLGELSEVNWPGSCSDRFPCQSVGD
ncbi:MAG: hypothetical protein ACTHZM_04935, partial [Canibacter sp.]